MGAPLDPDQRIELTVRLRAATGGAPGVPGTPHGTAPLDACLLSRSELTARRPDSEEHAAFIGYVRAAGRQLVDAAPGRRRIVLAGPAAPADPAVHRRDSARVGEHPAGRPHAGSAVRAAPRSR